MVSSAPTKTALSVSIYRACHRVIDARHRHYIVGEAGPFTGASGGTAFHQQVNRAYRRLSNGKLPLFVGHRLATAAVHSNGDTGHGLILMIGIMPQDKIRERALAVARGDYKPKASEPKIWFTSMKSLAEVLSDDNCALYMLSPRSSLNLYQRLQRLLASIRYIKNDV